MENRDNRVKTIKNITSRWSSTIEYLWYFTELHAKFNFFFLTIIDHKGHLHSRLTESATQSYPKDNPFNGGSARGKIS